MKHTGKMTTLATLALASALFLGACGNGNTQSQVPSSSAASVKTATSSSSSSKRLTASSSSKQTSSTASSVETAENTSQSTVASSSEIVTPVEKVVTSIATEVAAPAETPAPNAESALATAPAHLVGTWSNDQGVTITIHPDGTASNGAKLELYDNGSVGVRFKEGFGATLFYAPAGQEFSENIAPKEYTAGTDISKERLVIAQSVDGVAHPLYRTN